MSNKKETTVSKKSIKIFVIVILIILIVVSMGPILALAGVIATTLMPIILLGIMLFFAYKIFRSFLKW